MLIAYVFLLRIFAIVYCADLKNAAGSLKALFACFLVDCSLNVFGFLSPSLPFFSGCPYSLLLL